MNVDTRGPYTIDRIHYFKTEKGSQVRALTLLDGDGNQIGMRFPHLGDLRAAAHGFPLSERCSLTLSLGEPVIWNHATIRRWIAGRPLDATEPTETPVNSGLHVAGMDA
jgi:hypothetical protein